MLDEFEKYVADNELFTHDDKVLLTVSGGVDSMVLMSLTAAAGYNFGVAHCNFQLRGKESEEDEVLVEHEAKRLGVEFFNKRFDTVGEMERTGESMEMAARRLRYTWFRELCDEHGYTVIAIAHHINDSIETFFINMLRGTGLRGLTGITNHVGRIVRPLMFTNRKEIHDYAVAHRITNKTTGAVLTEPDVLGTFNSALSYPASVRLEQPLSMLVVVNPALRLYAYRKYELPINLASVDTKLYMASWRPSHSSSGWRVVNDSYATEDEN